MLPNLSALRLLALAAALALSAAAGAWVEHQRAEARVQNLLAEQAKRDAQSADMLAAAERANTLRLQAAQAAADAAIIEAQTRAAAATKRLESTRALLTAATRADRACLSADALRVLNRPPGAPAGTGLRLPTPTGSAVAAAAQPASDPARPAAASERAVADWIAQAQALYATCTARVDAIRSWAQAQP